MRMFNPNEDAFSLIGIRKGRERDIFRVLLEHKSMRTESACRAAARMSGLRATKQAAMKYKPVVARLMKFGVIEVSPSSKDRIRLNKRIFRRKDNYLIDLAESIKRYVDEEENIQSIDQIIKHTRQELAKKYGEVRILPAIIAKCILRGRITSRLSNSKSPKKNRASRPKLIIDKSLKNEKADDEEPIDFDFLESLDENEPLNSNENINKETQSQDKSYGHHGQDDMESDLKYLNNLIGVTDDPEDRRTAENRRTIKDQSLSFHSTTSTNLEEIANILESFNMTTELTDKTVLVCVECDNNRTQYVYLKIEEKGNRNKSIIEITSPIATTESAGKTDFDLIAKRLAYSSATNIIHKGKEYIALVSRLPFSSAIHDIIYEIVAEIAQSADELELSWIGEDIE